jgi:elongation factor Ts
MTATITASQVKELREATNVGMMECKKALTEACGDMDAAMKLLRERGMVIAGKKSDRAAKEGLIAAEIEPGAQSGVMIEVNCETDFVSRNENFQAFVADMLEKAKTVDGTLAEAYKDVLVAKIAEIGENLILRRNARYDVQGTGAVASYIHLGGKVGVLVEVGCEKADSVNLEGFKEVVKDVTLHIAAANPAHLDRSEVPAETIDAEKAIFAKQAEGKPEQIIEKIVTGKIEKFYSQICLVEQGFVKDPDQTVAQLLEAKGKEIGDTLSIRRFLRYQIGA